MPAKKERDLQSTIVRLNVGLNRVAPDTSCRACGRELDLTYAVRIWKNDQMAAPAFEYACLDCVFDNQN